MISTEFLLTSLIVVLIPGTGVLYTISIGLMQGGRASLFAALGCTVGIIPSLIACTLGLAAVIHTSAIVFGVIKFAGVGYLLYLAWAMWQETGVLTLQHPKQTNGTSSLPATKIALNGFLLNMLNPKLSLFFMAFLPQFIPTTTADPIFYIFVLGGCFMLMTLVVFIGYGLLANSVRPYVINSSKGIKIFKRTFAVTFAVLGAKLALSER